MIKYITQKMKFFIKDFFGKCGQIRRKLRNLVKFPEKFPNEKLHFLSSDKSTS